MAEYRYYNPNPAGLHIGDCVVRAICAVTGESWETIYTGIALQGYAMSDMPSANAVWGAYLRSKGYKRAVIPNECPDCYTVGDFADDHTHGNYVLCTGNHAVAVVDGGVVVDTWNSTSETPMFYFYKED
jgi:hypothetical protein